MYIKAGSKFAPYREIEVRLDTKVWKIRAYNSGEWNNDKYSKSYHRQYGGVWETYQRYVEFTRPWGSGTRTIKVKADSWRGDWVANAVVDAGLAPKKHRQHKSIRIHDAYAVHAIPLPKGSMAAATLDELKKRGTVKLYYRTLLGTPVDGIVAAITLHGRKVPITYHYDAYDPIVALGYLKDKLEVADARHNGNLITLGLLKSLGFCKQGIEDFAHKVGVSPCESITPQELKQHIDDTDRTKIELWSHELAVLSRAINYDLV